MKEEIILKTDGLKITRLGEGDPGGGVNGSEALLIETPEKSYLIFSWGFDYGGGFGEPIELENQTRINFQVYGVSFFFESVYDLEKKLKNDPHYVHQWRE